MFATNADFSWFFVVGLSLIFTCVDFAAYERFYLHRYQISNTNKQDFFSFMLETKRVFTMHEIDKTCSG